MLYPPVASSPPSHSTSSQGARRAARWPPVALAVGTSIFASILAPIAAAGAAPAAGAEPNPARRTLTLSQAEENALRNQPALRQAHAQTDAAQGRVEQARSGYLPQASGTATYQRITGNVVVRPGAFPGATASAGAMQSGSTTVLGSWSDRTYNFFNFGVTASQLIYDFGQTSGRWQSAAASRDATQMSELTTQQQALLAVRNTYFLARAGVDLIAVAQETLRNQEKHFTQIQAFVGAGIRPEIDLAQARTAVANARVQLVTATNNQAVALAQLEQAMGLVEGIAYELADSALAPVPGEDGALQGLIDAALGARPELATIQRQRRAQELTLKALRGGYGPALDATAGASEGGVSIDNLVPNWFVGLSLTWPFLQGGLTKGQVHEANGTLAALAAQEDNLRLSVRVEVEQGQLGVRAAKATIGAAQDAVVSARDQLRLAEARYAQGLGSVIELGDAQVAMSTAAAQDVQARFNLSAARAQLMAALGVR